MLKIFKTVLNTKIVISPVIKSFLLRDIMILTNYNNSEYIMSPTMIETSDKIHVVKQSQKVTAATSSFLTSLETLQDHGNIEGALYYLKIVNYYCYI